MSVSRFAGRVDRSYTTRREAPKQSAQSLVHRAGSVNRSGPFTRRHRPAAAARGRLVHAFGLPSPVPFFSSFFFSAAGSSSFQSTRFRIDSASK